MQESDLTPGFETREVWDMCHLRKLQVGDVFTFNHTNNSVHFSIVTQQIVYDPYEKKPMTGYRRCRIEADGSVIATGKQKYTESNRNIFIIKEIHYIPNDNS